MSDLFNQPTFDNWYDAFPRKVGKVVAQKAYRGALKAMSPQALQDAVEAFAAIENERTGYQKLKGKAKQDALEFVCHPSTWLNQGRWADEVIEEYLARPEVPETIVIKTGEPGYREWLKHDPSIKTYGGMIVVPTPLPPKPGEAGCAAPPELLQQFERR